MLSMAFELRRTYRVKGQWNDSIVAAVPKRTSATETKEAISESTSQCERLLRKYVEDARSCRCCGASVRPLNLVDIASQ